METHERPGIQAQLLDITHEAVIAFDVDERIVYWNRGAEATYGWSEREVLGKPAEEVLQPLARRHAAENRAERLALLGRNETLNGESCVQCKDHRLIEVEYNARAYFNSAGDLEGYVTVHREVTERRRAERALREREARLAALVEASPLGICIMDVQGNPVFYNRQCCELHGIDMSEAEGGRWEQAVHPDDRERVAVSWYRAAKTGSAWSDVYRFRHGDGRLVWVSGRAAPIHVDGALVGFVGTLEDITAERQARENAERAARVRDRMLAVVAHDLRNPLNAISLTAQALVATSVDDRHARELSVIERSAATMERLLGDLLDVSRIEAGFDTVEQGQVELDVLCRDAVDLFDVQARERGIELACEIAPDVPAVCGDPHRLTQVLSNLLGNALKFTPQGGRVTIRGEAAGDEAVRISVEDTGTGFRSEDLSRIFEPFWQGRTGDQSGTGLGLSICRAIVEAHGGRIRAENRPGGGAVVGFDLPR